MRWPWQAWGGLEAYLAATLGSWLKAAGVCLLGVTGQKKRRGQEGREGRQGRWVCFSAAMWNLKSLFSQEMNGWRLPPSHGTRVSITEKLFFSGMWVRMHFQGDTLISGSRGVRKVASWWEGLMAWDDADIYHLPLLTTPSFMVKSNSSPHTELCNWFPPPLWVCIFHL